MSGALVLIAARDEEGRVGPTVLAARAIDGVSDVVVVDDGSTDGTAREASGAGALVLVAPDRLGKGGALEGALSRLPPADPYLLLDADVGASAREAGRLLDVVAAGEADLAVGAPSRAPGHGGVGVARAASSFVIRALSGFRARQPLSGQRALTAEVMRAVRPLAGGFGVETAMTVDAVRFGFRVVEVPVEITHVPTGRDLSGFVHRGRQARDLLAAAAPRAVGLR